MNARLTVTTTYDDGYIETHTVDWEGWDVDDAAACYRKRMRDAGRPVIGTGRTYRKQLTAFDRETHAVDVVHEWADPDQPQLGDTK